MEHQGFKVFFMMLAVIFLYGCANAPASSTGTYTAGGIVGESTVSGGAASGRSVSGETISGNAITGEAISGSIASVKEDGFEKNGKSRYENDDNRYKENEEFDGLIQYRLDGTKVREIELRIDCVQWVSNDWIYYTSWDEEYQDALYRIPIEKTKKGDRLLTDRREKIWKASGIDIYYATSSYLILEQESDDAELYKYDLKTKKKTKLMAGEEDVSPLSMAGHFVGDTQVPDCQDRTLMLDGELFFETYKNLYRLDPETGKIAAVCATGEKYVDFALYRGELYLLRDNELYHFDRKSKKAETFISEESLINQLGKLESKEITKLISEEMALARGRMYLVFRLQWRQEERETGRDVLYQRDGLFSMQITEPGRISREDVLMDYLDKKGKYETTASRAGELRAEHTCSFDEYTEGTACFEYCYKKKGKEYSQYIFYDLTTKEIEERDEDELVSE